MYIAAEQELNVGLAEIIEAPAQNGSFVVVFEDDENTGYFYALDTASLENPIQEALHIYNVADVADKHKPSTVRIGWSSDHCKAILLINDYPHAVFDFETRQGYCRSAWPGSFNNEWSENDRRWDERVLEWFA